MPIREIDLGPGIVEPICGWEWIRQHLNDPYPEPRIELVTPTSRYCMTIKKAKVIKEVSKVIKGG